jgi:hypothetical protein
MSCNNIFVPVKFGFGKGVANEKYAYSLAQSVLNSRNQTIHTRGIFSDLAAFDCVNHYILLSKLHFMVFKVTCKLDKTHTRDRKHLQQIKSHCRSPNFFSKWEEKNKGFPEINSRDLA